MQRFSLIFLILFLACTYMHGQIVNYNWPSTAPKSDFYSIKVTQNGTIETLYTHVTQPNLKTGPTEGSGVTAYLNDRSLSYVIFSFTGEVDVEVTKLYGTNAQRVEISPKEFGINPYYFDGKKVKFKMSDKLLPSYVSVNFVSDDNKDSDRSGGFDIMNGIMIFGDRTETNIPSQTATGTLVYNNSTTLAQMQAASTIYFPPGDWDLINNITDNLGNKGRYTVNKNGQKIYLAGGAFVRGSINAEGYDNLSLSGRGIITGIDYYWHQMVEIKSGVASKTAYLDYTGSDNMIFDGVAIVNPCHHTCPSGRNSRIKNIKILGWASNHDGIRPGSGALVDQIFIKTSDDYDYARDPHTVQNSIFWPMNNGASGQLGWNNLGSGFTTYKNMYYINSEWATYNRNRGIIGSVLNQGVALEKDSVVNIYATDFCSLLANITIEYDATVAFDNSKPGEIKNFLFKNIVFENTFKAANGTIIKNPIKGFERNGVKATIHDITFTNLILGNELITTQNASKYFDIDPNTTYNIKFDTQGQLYNLNTIANANGMVSPSGNLPTPAGMDRTVNIIANTGFKIKDVKVNGVSIGRVQHYRFTNINANQTIEATFEAGNDYYDFTPLATSLKKDSELKKNLLVYPTKSTGKYTISNNSGQNFGIFVLNAEGKSIYQINSLNRNQSINLDLSNQAAGVYQVIFQKENINYSQPIIKE